MNKISIYTAVVMSLKAIGDDPFSIHNITTMIREELAQGNYELSSGPVIFHEEVKDAFLELMGNVYADQYLTRHAAGGYREFKRDNSRVTNTVSQPTTPVAPTPTAPITLNPNTPACLTPNGFGATLTNMILSYLANGPKTTKQIQSRFKSHKLTCEEIAKFLEVCNMIDTSTKTLPFSRMMSR